MAKPYFESDHFIGGGPTGTIEAEGFVLARAKRYQAEICRLQNQQLGVANTLCSDALAAIAPHAPLTSRDLLEEAEINELQGCDRFGLNFNNAADQSLSDRYRRGDAQGSVISPGSLLQDQLV